VPVFDRFSTALPGIADFRQQVRFGSSRSSTLNYDTSETTLFVFGFGHAWYEDATAKYLGDVACSVYTIPGWVLLLRPIGVLGMWLCRLVLISMKTPDQRGFDVEMIGRNSKDD